MNSRTRKRNTVIAAVTSLALLAGASSASAKLPSLGVQLNAGQVAVDLDANAIRGQAGDVAAGQVANVQRRLRSTTRSLKRTERRLRSIERRLGSRTHRLYRRTLRRVRSLRRSVRRLSRRVVSYAVAEARSATNGSWLVVTRTGRILEQSGGLTVTHLGTGTYRVSWSTSSNCFALSGGAPIGSPVHIDPVGVGAMVVHVSAEAGPKDLGFYLAAAC